MKVFHTGRVDNGVLTIRSRRAFDRELKAFDGKDVYITIEKKSKKRSTQQNRYYWGVCIALACECYKSLGYRVVPDTVHEIFRKKFLQATLVNEDTGEVIEEYIKSTTYLSTTEFMEYIEEIIQYMAENFGCVIPDPSTVIDAE